MCHHPTRATLSLAIVIAFARAQYHEYVECKGLKVSERVSFIMSPILTSFEVIVVVVTLAVVALATTAQ